MTNTQIDLRRLALDRAPPTGARTAKRGNRKLLTRYLIPVAILLGFAGLLLATSGNLLRTRTSVEVIPVVVMRASAQLSGTALFQAAGWIEPRPTAIDVPALAPGVIEELFVVEGQLVEQGDPIAKLNSIDAEIAVKQAKAELAITEAELERIRAEQKAAKIRQENPIHLHIKIAEAKSKLARANTELAKLPFLIESAEANLNFAKQNAKGKREAGIAVPGVVREKAEAELASADASLRELKRRKSSLLSEMNAHEELVSALQAQLKLLVDETRQLEEANAKVQSALAIRDAAKLTLEFSELVLQRNTIRAPIKGRILQLVVMPGMRVMGLEATDDQNSSSVVQMYDPTRLQVRADVRLEDVSLVQPGQPVEMETASTNSTIYGRVLQSNSTANIQKNTLEVKVEILNPPENIRPEMLVTATFLSPEKATDKPDDQTTTSNMILVPKQLVRTEASESFVWIVDADQRARKRSIVSGKIIQDELIEVTGGLTVTDKLIATETANLNDGSFVNITGEDRSIGK